MQAQQTQGAHLRHHRGDAHCSRCAPGWGVAERCGLGRDTRCAECQPGTYSPHHGTQPCWLCSRCGPGLYEARRCTSSADTVCDSCRAVLGHHPAPEDSNEDYKRKCGPQPAAAGTGGQGVFLAPEDARSTGEQSELVNEDRPGLDGPEERERERLLWEDARAQIEEDEAAAARVNDVAAE